MRDHFAKALNTVSNPVAKHAALCIKRTKGGSPAHHAGVSDD